MRLKPALLLIWQTVMQSFADNVPLLAAGVAFYAMVSIAPLLVIVISLAGLVFGQEAAEGRIVAELGALVGTAGAEAIQGMIKRTSQPESSLAATLIGFLVLAFGASRLFNALQVVLNSIWGVQIKTTPGLWRGFIATVRDRAFSLLMVLGTVFLLLISLLVSTALSAIMKYFHGLLPGADAAWQWGSLIVGFLITTAMFAAILRGIPDVVLRWRDVLTGAVVTSLLFGVGRYLMGFYLGQGSFASVYGAAASLVIILFWMYYSAQILCLGAEFTKLYVIRHGGPIRTRSRAQFIEPPREEIDKAEEKLRVSASARNR